MKRPNYLWVDALRGLAVLLVFMHHIIVIAGRGHIPSQGAWKIFDLGWIGVDLFFIISGFVVPLSIFRSMDIYGKRHFVCDYARKRLSRIVPLYALTSLIFVVFVDHHFWLESSEWRAANVLTHAFFIHNIFPLYAGAINGSAWSLGVEMQFYLLIAVLLFFWPRRHALLLIPAGIGIAIVWRLVCFSLLGGDAEKVPQLMFSASQIFGTLDAFFMGAAIALIVASREHFLHSRLLPSVRHAAFYGLTGLALGALTWNIFWQNATYWDSMPMVVGWRTLLALSFMFFLLMSMTMPVCKPLERLMQPLLYTGKISYGIYLWHIPVIVSFMKTGLGHGRMLFWIVVATFTLSAFTWHFFEKPIMERYRNV